MFIRFQRNLVALSLLLGMAACSVVVADERDEKALHVEETSPADRFDKGNKWAVLIGINSYLDPKIKHLDYCVSDAHLMEKVLIEKCGYEKRRILIISDDQQREERKPFLINLQEQTREWLFLAKPEDTVLVFFSGHGFLGKKGEGYLAPKNCRRDNLALSAFPTNELRGMLDNCKASQKILILDCCNAGAKGEGDSSSQEIGQTFTKAKGLITLASCMKNEVSEEWDLKKQGLFTYFLAAGLAGLADKDRNGIVDSDELYKYVSDEVPLAPHDIKNELKGAKPQHPVRIIGSDVVGVFSLARVSLRPEMVLESSDAMLRFTVRNSSSKADLKPVVADAVVELLYRSSENARPQVLAKGTSDERGHVTLKADLTAAQQVKGEFLALVTRGEQSEMWRLTDFSKRGNWDLTIPVPSKPSLLIAPFDKQTATAKQTAWGKHLKREVIETNKLGMKMVLIPPGEFTMGSPDSELGYGGEHAESESPQHQVQITKPFYLASTEVTQQQWQAVMETTPWKGEEYVKEGNDYAATYVSWEDAQQYVNKLSRQEGVTYRLPSEAEWEYACRAGSESRYCFGESTETLKEYAWFDENADDVGEEYAHRVGRKYPNGFGLFDLHGNVWEWCSDWGDDDYYGTLSGKTTQNPTGPSAAGSSRVLRGGSWSSYPESVCSAYRSRSSPSNRNDVVGFRVVRVVE